MKVFFWIFFLIFFRAGNWWWKACGWRCPSTICTSSASPPTRTTSNISSTRNSFPCGRIPPRKRKRSSARQFSLWEKLFGQCTVFLLPLHFFFCDKSQEKKSTEKFKNLEFKEKNPKTKRKNLEFKNSILKNFKNQTKKFGIQKFNFKKFQKSNEKYLEFKNSILKNFKNQTKSIQNSQISKIHLWKNSKTLKESKIQKFKKFRIQNFIKFLLKRLVEIVEENLNRKILNKKKSGMKIIIRNNCKLGGIPERPSKLEYSKRKRRQFQRKIFDWVIVFIFSADLTHPNPPKISTCHRLYPHPFASAFHPLTPENPPEAITLHRPVVDSLLISPPAQRHVPAATKSFTPPKANSARKVPLVSGIAAAVTLHDINRWMGRPNRPLPHYRTWNRSFCPMSTAGRSSKSIPCRGNRKRLRPPLTAAPEALSIVLRYFSILLYELFHDKINFSSIPKSFSQSCWIIQSNPINPNQPRTTPIKPNWNQWRQYEQGHYGTEICLEVCTPRLCCKVCALPCCSKVDWLIDGESAACPFFHFLWETILDSDFAFVLHEARLLCP